MVRIVFKTRSGDLFAARRDEEVSATREWVAQLIDDGTEWLRVDGCFVRISEVESISIRETSFPGPVGGDA